MSLHPREWRVLHEIDRRLSAEDPQMAQWLAGDVRWRHPKRLIVVVYLVAPTLLVLGIVLGFMPVLIIGVALTVATPVAGWRLLRPPATDGGPEDLLDDL